MTPTTDQFTALAEWDTPALSNALDSLRLRPHHTGYTDGSITRLVGDGAMVGTAVTAKMVARDFGEDGIPVAKLHELVAAVDGPVVVVLEDVDATPGAGAFLGEVNGSLLAALQISGFVTNGRVRDINELRGAWLRRLRTGPVRRPIAHAPRRSRRSRGRRRPRRPDLVMSSMETSTACSTSRRPPYQGSSTRPPRSATKSREWSSGPARTSSPSTDSSPFDVCATDIAHEKYSWPVLLSGRPRIESRPRRSASPRPEAPSW